MRMALLILTGVAGVTATPAAAQAVRPAPLPPSAYADEREIGRELGRAVGQATVAAESLAARARVAARQAAREYRRGYSEGLGGAPSPRRYGIVSEDEAVNSCAMAAEYEAEGFAPIASVENIIDVERFGEGWDIEGTVETRDGYRDSARDEWRFRCAIRGGEVESVRIEDDLARR